MEQRLDVLDNLVGEWGEADRATCAHDLHISHIGSDRGFLGDVQLIGPTYEVD